MGMGRGIAKGIAIGVKSLVDKAEQRRRAQALLSALEGGEDMDYSQLADTGLEPSDIIKIVDYKSKKKLEPLELASKIQEYNKNAAATLKAEREEELQNKLGTLSAQRETYAPLMQKVEDISSKYPVYRGGSPEMKQTMQKGKGIRKEWNTLQPQLANSERTPWSGEDLDTELKRANLDVTRRVAAGMDAYGDTGTGVGAEPGGKIIYRELVTGEVANEEQANLGRKLGKQYKAIRLIPSRQGIKEVVVGEPVQRTEEERSFISNYPQAKKDIEDLIQRLTPETKAPLGGFVRLSTGKRWLLGKNEEDLRRLQEPYTRVLKTFLFGPAGKALTGTERPVLERAVDPTGKSPEEWERDLIAGLNVIGNRYELLTSGTIPTSTENIIQQPVNGQSSIKSKYGLD